MYEFEVEGPSIELTEDGKYKMKIAAAGNLDMQFEIVLDAHNMAEAMPVLIGEWHGVQAKFYPEGKDDNE